jgi:hypothetical protein
MIIELGDAQVAGLPGKTEPQAFYEALQSRLTVHVMSSHVVVWHGDLRSRNLIAGA